MNRTRKNLTAGVECTTLVDEGKAGVLVLIVDNAARFAELHDTLRRSLNTRPDAAQWLFELCDAMEADPMPKRHSDRNENG